MPVYIVEEKVELEPGTLLVNSLHRGCLFKTTGSHEVKDKTMLNKVVMIDFIYLDYGRFTGKKDALWSATFNELVKSGVFKLIKE